MPLVVLLQNKLYGNHEDSSDDDGGGKSKSATGFADVCKEYTKARRVVDDGVPCLFVLFSTKWGPQYEAAVQKLGARRALTEGTHQFVSPDGTIRKVKIGIRKSKSKKGKLPQLTVRRGDVVLLMSTADTAKFHNTTDTQRLLARKAHSSPLTPDKVLGK